MFNNEVALLRCVCEDGLGEGEGNKIRLLTHC